MLSAWGMWHDETAKKSVKIIQIEPRASNTASKATDWIPVRPGTECALALGIAHVMIKDGKYNKEFVENYTFGFNDWVGDDGRTHMGFKTLVLNEYPPDRVSKITGLSPGMITNLAHEFASASRPIAVCGKGKGGMGGSVLEFMSILAINALSGSINMPGGVLLPEPIPFDELPEVELDQVTLEGLNKPRVDMAGGRKYPLGGSLAHMFGKVISQAKESPVDILMVFSSNPAYTLPGAETLRSALKKIPFIVSFSPYRDDTSMFADLILPDHTHLEKREDIVWPPGLQYALVGISKPVVEPLYDTRHTGDVIIQIAKAVGDNINRSFPWKNFDECLKARVKGIFQSGEGLISYDGSTPPWKQMDKAISRAGFDSFDDMWKNINSGGLWFRPAHRYGNWDRIFKTPTGKFEFYSNHLETLVRDITGNGKDFSGTLKAIGLNSGDMAFMPHYEPVLSQSKKGYILVPYEIINLSSDWYPTPPYAYKSIFDHELLGKDSFVEINKITADELGVKEGDRVEIVSPNGSAQVRVHICDGAMPGVIFMPAGFGHKGYDDFQMGKGANPNDIIVPDEDPISGYPLWWKTTVQIRKI
jgi:anaerobic selenocysteine-containing dehydrogenase